jgi:hypothetical protein
MPLAALQVTAPAFAGLTATSTSAMAELPEVADGVVTARTTAFAARMVPGAPGQLCCALLT